MAIIKLNKKASMGTAVFSAVSLKLCLAIAFLSLGFAFYQVYKKKKVDCGNCETDKPSFFKSKFYVWLVAVFVAVMTLVSYYPQLFHRTKGNELVIVNQRDIQSVKLGIEGMVCQSCETNINNSVNKIDGVIQIKTSFKKGVSVIEFDSTKTNINDIKKVVQSKGYVIKKSKNE